MSDLIATKPLRYATRRLLAGEGFQAKPRHARVLVAIGKARPADIVEPLPVDEVAAARAEYEKALGKRPFMGWDLGTLRQKIADHSAAG